MSEERSIRASAGSGGLVCFMAADCRFAGLAGARPAGDPEGGDVRSDMAACGQTARLIHLTAQSRILVYQIRIALGQVVFAGVRGVDTKERRRRLPRPRRATGRIG